jgi:hypothetical protein
MRRVLLLSVFACSMLVPVAAQAAISCQGTGPAMFCHGTDHSGTTTINYVDVKVAPVQGQVQVAQIDDGTMTYTGAGACAAGHCESRVTTQLPLLPPIP